MEDGRPFCPSCRAPQVRVEFEPPPAVLPSPPEIGITPDALNTASVRSGADPTFFRTAFQAGLLGVMAVLLIPGLGMVLTGILAALLGRRASGGNLPGSKGARVGAMAGAIAFAATSFLGVLAVVVLNLGQQFHDYMMKAFEQSLTRQSGPDVQSALQLLHTPEGFGMVLALFMVAALLLSMLLSALGGVIGSMLFRNRNRPPF